MDLLPCPFCGGKAEFNPSPIAVICLCCGVRTRSYIGTRGEFQAEEFSARSDWNQRTAKKRKDRPK